MIEPPEPSKVPLIIGFALLIAAAAMFATMNYLIWR